MSHYMVLRSDQSLDYYPNNKPYHFKAKLQQNIELPGKWKIALLEIALREQSTASSKEELYIYCNLCGESVINGSNAPLLRRVVVPSRKNTIFTSCYYIPVVKSEVNEIEIIVKDSHGVPVGKLLQQPVTLVIHLRAYPFYSV